MTEAPLDPARRGGIGPTSRRGRVAILLGPTDGFSRREPLNLQTRFGPAAHRLSRVEVNEAGVGAAARVSNANHIGVAGAAGAVGAAEGAALAGGGGGGGVDVGVAGAGGGAVEGGLEEREGAVEVDDGVGTGDIEGEGAVELDPLVHLIGRDARVLHERRGLDHKALRFGVDGLDRVRVVQRVEYECAGAAPDFVRLVAACRGGAEGKRHRGVAARGARRGRGHLRGA